MNKIVLDGALRSKLNNLDAEVEICDETGHTVGFFLPVEQHRQLLYAWAKAQVSEGELEEARQEPGGRPLSEILARLRSS
jgi:hypothetical protein